METWEKDLSDEDKSLQTQMTSHNSKERSLKRAKIKEECL